MDDLGRSGSGIMDRPGFQKFVALVCSGSVGAVYCIEASRLARNGRDWHHLIDLCALVGALVIDGDGTYDPRLVNDRLLLGLKGTMSEYELSLLRQRGLAARDSKAKRSLEPAHRRDAPCRLIVQLPFDREVDRRGQS
jgi:DNA invertase Pin-like site-specific DNA recombinase